MYLFLPVYFILSNILPGCYTPQWWSRGPWRGCWSRDWGCQWSE